VDLGALVLFLSLTCHAGQAVPAQLPPPAAAPAPPWSARWSAGVEYQRDRFDYRFENSSSYDGSGLVPHAFEQRYDAGSVWLTGRLRFALGTRPFETEGGATTTSTGTGSDYDTFDQRDGNVIVYGTAAVTDVWSWRAAQYIGLGSWLGVQWRAAYSYRRDRAHFRPSYTTIAQTKPPSSTAFWNTDRETTISEVHEVRIGAERAFAPGPGWRVRVTADAAPTTLARLTTILPDKYPDPVVFIAKGLSMNAALHMTRRIGRWHVGAVVSYAQAWPYTQSSTYHRKAVSAAVTFGR
jgi:hypothetical protein